MLNVHLAQRFVEANYMSNMRACVGLIRHLADLSAPFDDACFALEASLQPINDISDVCGRACLACATAAASTFGLCEL